MVVAAILVLTGVIDTGDDDSPSPAAEAIRQPVADRSGDGLTINEIYERANARGRIRRGGGRRRRRASHRLGCRRTGEGRHPDRAFVLDEEGYILTNAHVVERADAVTVTFANDEQAEAEIVGADLSSDLAVVKVDPDEADLQPLPLGAERGPGGRSDGRHRQPVRLRQHRDLPGRVRHPAPDHRTEVFSIDNVIQTDASINPGNSGAPSSTLAAG